MGDDYSGPCGGQFWPLWGTVFVLVGDGSGPCGGMVLDPLGDGSDPSGMSVDVLRGRPVSSLHRDGSVSDQSITEGHSCTKTGPGPGDRVALQNTRTPEFF